MKNRCKKVNRHRNYVIIASFFIPCIRSLDNLLIDSLLRIFFWEVIPAMVKRK